MFRRLIAARTPAPRPAPKLRLEPLDGRVLPAVTLAPIPDQPVTNNVAQFLPVTVTNTPNGAVSYTVSSDNPAVTPSVVQAGRSVRFTVAGKNPDGTDFTGDLVIRLFEDTAPQATRRIVDLVNQDYYDGKLFHRVSGGFLGPNDTIIQGGSKNGNGTGGSGLGTLPDEFSPSVRFNSPGIVAAANAGDDTTDQQFFIVRPSTPLERRPQFLNYNFTVLGILTAGADVYEKINATPRRPSPDDTFPASPVTITDAQVFADPANGVVRLDTQPGFTGTARITVTPADADGVSPGVTATVTGTTANPVDASGNPLGNPPFLGALPADLSTNAGQPVTFSVPYTDVDGSPVTIAVRDASFAAAPANVTVSVSQAAGTVTLTPAAGFTGTISLRVGVRDDVDRSRSGDINTASNFDTQALTLTVTPSTAVPAAAVALTANPTTAAVGQAVTLTAAVSAQGVASPAGTVEFRSGNTTLATAAVVNGVATTVATFPAAGAQTLLARFTPADANVVTAGISPAVSFTVTPAATGAVTPAVALSATPLTVATGESVSLTATVTAPAGTAVAGTVQFFAGGTLLASAGVNNGQAVATTSFAAAGSQTLSAVFTPADPAVLTGASSSAVTVAVAAPGGGSTPAAGTTARGSGRGQAPRVTVFNADGSERVSFLAFEEGFTGGVRTAVADVTGDGVPDVVAVPGFGGGPVVKVFDSVTGATLAARFVMDEGFRGGLTLAAGDTGGLGYARVAVGAGETGAPRVVVFDFRQNRTVLDFFAYDETLRGGVSVAMARLPGGTGADLVTGVGAGGGPRVNVYDGATGKLMGSRFYGDETRRDGIGVRVGDDFGSTAIYVNTYQPDRTTAQAPIDTTFVNFSLAGGSAATDPDDEL